MSLVLRRTYMKAKNNFLNSGNAGVKQPYAFHFKRNNSDESSGSNPQFSSSTIMIENGYNVQELPVIVRKIRNLSEINEKPSTESAKSTNDSLSFHLIQEEFKQCLDLRDVFSLLSKCTKITPNIALGAMERIYDLEKNPNTIALDTQSAHINLAKGAILDKLLKVVMKTEDTQTILNILNTVSCFMEPYKHKFCDELICRVSDNRLSIEQLCNFTKFLVNNKSDPRYSDMIDKVWVGFVERESEINEANIDQVFEILNGLKVSKRIILNLLEQKLSYLCCKIKVTTMQGILNTFIQEKYLSMHSFAVVGNWLYSNIHALDEDSLLDIISKLTILKYTDNQVEKAVEKYVTLKISKINSYVLIVGILNYCMQFQINNKRILHTCSEYFIVKGSLVPSGFLKSIIYPFGNLYFDPVNTEFWINAEKTVLRSFNKMLTDDLLSIILSYLYVGKYPMDIIKRVFSYEYLMNIKNGNTEALKKLNLIDTSLSLECENYAGPLMPKALWSKAVIQDNRVKNILNKTISYFVNAAGSPDNISTAVLIPHLCSDETYLIDIMIHPAGLDCNNVNWKSKLVRNENVAILIHLPDHYCFANEQLIGPQIMKKRHLKILGFRVASLKYSQISQFYTSYNTSGLREYIANSIENAESCL
ncbi:hypothetical protein K1T71_001710 [Dendrolimus kikuchii]|uniref:Uncharacterized protein n=1 Tax=Dendrolimus kikuchii TaxID=765133 RepID=A0ACC1DG71_9NEOP|nr:hypothetical protein K1T71_001710 [Dendrolimus kikuchii]